MMDGEAGADHAVLGEAADQNQRFGAQVFQENGRSVPKKAE